MMKITADCINCGTCFERCSNQGIKEENGKYVIDQEKCQSEYGCSVCVAVCPTECIIDSSSDKPPKNRYFMLKRDCKWECGLLEKKVSELETYYEQTGRKFYVLIILYTLTFIAIIFNW